MQQQSEGYYIKLISAANAIFYNNTELYFLFLFCGLFNSVG